MMKPSPSFLVRLLTVAFIAGLLAASSGSAQQGTVNIKSVFDTSNTQVQPGDAANNALRANVVAGTVAASQSGTWTVQPGNTANTTPWLVSISQGGNTAAVNASSQLNVNCAAGCAGGPADESAFTFGTTGIFSGGVFQTTPTSNALTTGQAGVFQVTASRALFVNLRDSVGGELNRSNPLAVLDTTLRTAGDPAAVGSGRMMLASVAPTPPIYNRGQLQPLSLTTLGALRTDSSDRVQPTLPRAMSSFGSTPLIFCDQSAAINTASSGYTQLVPRLGGETVYVCGYTFVSTSALAVKFAYGTGTNCATGTVDMTGAMAVAANGGVVNPVGVVPTLITPAGQAFCVNLSAATQVSGHITYGQF